MRLHICFGTWIGDIRYQVGVMILFLDINSSVLYDL